MHLSSHSKSHFRLGSIFVVSVPQKNNAFYCHMVLRNMSAPTLITDSLLIRNIRSQWTTTHFVGYRVHCWLIISQQFIKFMSNFCLTVNISKVHNTERSSFPTTPVQPSNGFKFSSSKTGCMHFCRLRKPHPDPTLTLYGAAIPVVQEVKFLGLIFDSKLSFLPHLRYLKKKCMKALNLLLQVRFKCIIYCAQN